MLVACEESGEVRDAFLRAGHDAVSCDLEPSAKPGPHIQGDVRDLDLSAYGLIIAFPPCTTLAVSGNGTYGTGKPKAHLRDEGLELVRFFMDAPCDRIAIENPIGVISSRIRKPDQIIQPWMFGHGETKALCLWLKNLPKLVPTNIVEGREQRVWRMAPSPTRARDRSRTYPGVAEAMAEQWGKLDSTVPADEEK